MGLLDFFGQIRSNARIRSLESEVEKRPTPDLFLQLADAHRIAGNGRKAAQILKLGAARFPGAPEITRKQVDAEKDARQQERRHLAERIQTHPNPILYARLAALYRADGDLDKTMESCQDGIKAFPKYGGMYQVLGELYMDQKRWAAAAVELERAATFDRFNFLALKLLAQVFMELGRPAEAVQRYEEILRFSPGHEEILELLRVAKETASDAASGKTSTLMPAIRAPGAPESKIVASGSSRASAAGSSAAMRSLASASGLLPASASARTLSRTVLIRESLAQLHVIPGVIGAILADAQGLVIGSDIDATLDEGLASAMLTEVYRTASGNAGALNIGAFEECQIDSSEGHIHLRQLGEMILMVFARPDVKAGLLEASIRDFGTMLAQ